MFDAFEARFDPRSARRLTAAAGAALTVAALLLLGARVLSQTAPLLPRKKSVEVAFRPPPPPAPEVKLENAPRPKPPPAPPPRVVKAEPAPAPAPMVAPVEVPKQPLPEAPEPTAPAIRVEVGGTGSGVVPAAGGPPVAPEPDESPAPQAAVTGPLNLPEEAEPPEADDGNAMPEYPEVARAAGQESVVILKVVIESDGTVGRVQVLKGEEPFLAAALEAVRSWRYSPAQLEGRPIAVYRIVKIPFRLRS
ncbi:MAG: energy transducer TonB [Archangiaceae bacterium]|nr:energy transducer TonB [Archangiaceae bacterium]